jgi:hypothetical protein
MSTNDTTATSTVPVLTQVRGCFVTIGVERRDGTLHLSAVIDRRELTQDYGADVDRDGFEDRNGFSVDAAVKDFRVLIAKRLDKVRERVWAEWCEMHWYNSNKNNH